MKSNFPWSILEHLDLYYNLLMEVTFNDSKEINFRTFGFLSNLLIRKINNGIRKKTR